MKLTIPSEFPRCIELRAALDTRETLLSAKADLQKSADADMSEADGLEARKDFDLKKHSNIAINLRGRADMARRRVAHIDRQIEQLNQDCAGLFGARGEVHSAVFSLAGEVIEELTAHAAIYVNPDSAADVAQAFITSNPVGSGLVMLEREARGTEVFPDDAIVVLAQLQQFLDLRVEWADRIETKTNVVAAAQ